MKETVTIRATLPVKGYKLTVLAFVSVVAIRTFAGEIVAIVFTSSAVFTRFGITRSGSVFRKYFVVQTR